MSMDKRTGSHQGGGTGYAHRRRLSYAPRSNAVREDHRTLHGHLCRAGTRARLCRLRARYPSFAYGGRFRPVWGRHAPAAHCEPSRVHWRRQRRGISRSVTDDAGEPFRLLERITIKVSRFYRHAPAFDHLRDAVLPALAQARGGEPLQLWCAGCGAGEEPYTLAMLMEKAASTGFIGRRLPRP